MCEAQRFGVWIRDRFKVLAPKRGRRRRGKNGPTPTQIAVSQSGHQLVHPMHRPCTVHPVQRSKQLLLQIEFRTSRRLFLKNNLDDLSNVLTKL